MNVEAFKEPMSALCLEAECAAVVIIEECGGSNRREPLHCTPMSPDRLRVHSGLL